MAQAAVALRWPYAERQVYGAGIPHTTAYQHSRLRLVCYSAMQHTRLLHTQCRFIEFFSRAGVRRGSFCSAALRVFKRYTFVVHNLQNTRGGIIQNRELVIWHIVGMPSKTIAKGIHLTKGGNNVRGAGNMGESVQFGRCQAASSSNSYKALGRTPICVTGKIFMRLEVLESLGHVYCVYHKFARATN